MALLDSEGFGLSSRAADYFQYTNWAQGPGSVVPLAYISPEGPLGDNYLTLSNGTAGWFRALPSSYGTVIFGMRMQSSLVTGPNRIIFADSSALAQVGLEISTTGVITALRGPTSGASGYTGGTSLGASAANAFRANTWNYLECRVFVDATSGSVEVRVNGDVVLSLTGVNTKGSGSSSTIQRVGIQTLSGGLLSAAHMYICDPSGSAPQNTFLGDVRVQSLRPISNGTTQFTPGGGTTAMLPTPASGTVSPTQNTITYLRVQVPATGVLTGLQFQAGGTAATNFNQMALYSDVNGEPDTLLASSATAAGWAIGTNIRTVTGGPSLVAGDWVWVAFNWQLSSSSLVVGAASGYTQVRTQSRTATLGFPATASPSIGSANPPLGLIITSVSNFENVSESSPGTSTSYNTDSVVSDQDLFNMGPIASGTPTIFGTNTKVLARKTDAGSIGMTPLIKSGSTTGSQAGTSLAVTPVQISMINTLNPDTGAAWTAAEINAVQAGYRVT